ncbi:MAG: ABC transporter ATP-binding protein [Bowdeniella nasicola]|nr:ABC transporter ATP-binding protein [Bowdeniella nasicola]
MSARRRELTRWMLSVTRPVLAPLAASALSRVAGQLAAVAIVAFAGYQVTAIGIAARAGALEGTPLWSVLGVLVALAVAKAVLRYAEQFLGHLVAFRALELLRGEVYTLLAPQAPAIARIAWSGDLLSRITRDIDRIEVFFAHTFAPAVSAVLVPTVVVLGAGFTVGWPAALVCLIAYLMGGLGAPLLGSRAAASAAGEALRLRGLLTQHVTDSVQGVREVVGYGRVAERLADLSALEEPLAETARTRAGIAGARRGLVSLTHYAGLAGILVVGSAAVRSGAASVPWLVALLLGFAASWDNIRAVEDFVLALDNSFASAARITALRGAAPEMPDGERDVPAGPLELRCERVTFSYPGERGGPPALRDVSVHIPAGRWTCVLGVTGSGKSTLSALALRYFDPDEGRVLLGGEDLRELSRARVLAAATIVTQRAHVFRGTIASNLRLGAPDADDDALWRALALADVDEDVRRLNGGINAPVGEGGRTLSGGQRQRLCLARALLRPARLIVLDEYTAHLDAAQAATVRDRVRAARPDATVIEVTHRVEGVRGADHVIVMDRGVVLEHGTPAELLARDGALSRLAGRS